MKTKTLFLAYEKCRTGMEYARMYRGRAVGIARDYDYFATEWQRYNRLAQKLRRKILERLKE